MLDKATDLPLSFVQFGLIALGYPIVDPPASSTRRPVRAIRATGLGRRAADRGAHAAPDPTRVLAAAVIGDQHAETAVGV